MIRIFLMFFALMWANLVFAEQNQGADVPVSEAASVAVDPSLLSPTEEIVYQAAKHVFMPLKNWMAQVRQMDTEKVNIKAVDNPLTALYLMTTSEVNPLTGTRGYGEWKTYPFGRMRLVSCNAGLVENEPAFVGIQAQIHSDWALYKPNIILTTPARETVISYPLSLKLPKGITRTFLYDGDTVFPVFFMPEAFDKALDVSVTVEWRALNPYTKKDIFGTDLFQIKLTPEKAYETGICPYMMSFLSVSPAPVRDNLTLSATVNAYNQVQLFFEFKQVTDDVSVQIDDEWTFVEEKKNVKGKVAEMVIMPSRMLHEGDVLPVKVITSYGIYDVPTVLKSGNFYQDTPAFDWMGILIAGVGLFFLTPLFPYFLAHAKSNAEQVKKDAGQTLIFLSVTGIIWTLAWQAGLVPVIDLVQHSQIIFWLTVGGLIWWLLRPGLSLGAVGVLIVFLPKPYLTDVAGLVTYYSFAPVVIGGMLTVMMMYPFWWIYRYPDIFVIFHQMSQKDTKAVFWLTRLPALVLLIWLILGGMVSSDSLPYTARAVRQAVSDGQVVFVSVEPPVCLSCRFLQTSFAMSRTMRRLKDENGLIQMTAPLESFDGKELMKYYAQTSVPLNVLYGPKNPNGIIIPAYVDYAELNDYLDFVK